MVPGMEIEMPLPLRLTYLFDPLCGWCYGASPVITRLAAEPRIAVTLAPTGLFAGDGARPMSAQFAEFAWSNDQRIARLTGQVFSDAYRRDILGDHSSLFDSAPATLAVVAVQITRPERAVAALTAIQNARYVDGRDTTRVTVLREILTSMDLTDAASLVGSPDDALLTAYRETVANARADMTAFGLEGVPALIVEAPEGRYSLKSNGLMGDPERVVEQLLLRQDTTP